jgi:Protein of unknown function (DUF3823) N-terminal domain/Domain of unknown function (DUF3823_C)
MRNSSRYLFILAFAVTIFSCKKDNYAEPKSLLTGHLVYQGDSIGVEKNAVHFQIYQYGFGKVGPVSTDETFAQGGSYSAVLYDGDYKIIIPNGDGPFMWKKTAAGDPDSVSVTLKGNQTVDLEVTPYYMIKTPQIAAVGTDSISATCMAAKIITDSINAKDIEYVALYVNKTQFVAGSTSIASYTVPASAITNMNNIQLGVHVPALVPAQSYLFARIGLKIANVEDLIFSPLQKIQF